MMQRAVFWVLVFTVFSTVSMAQSNPSDDAKLECGLCQKLFDEILRDAPSAERFNYNSETKTYTTLEVEAPSPDVRIILNKFVPDGDKYFQILVDHLDAITISQAPGKLLVDFNLVPQSLTVTLGKREEASRGQPYEVKLANVVHVEITSDEEHIILDKISGFSIFVKIPFFPDAIFPTRFDLQLDTDKLTMKGAAFGGLLKFVAKANVRAKRYYGIDWLETWRLNFHWR